ncbi:MAG: NADPH-dependent assimilatory sulfite reductase hemoprotein subunit, partial [Planctomycetia bacterium]
WHEQGDGKLWVGVHIVCGRIKDDESSTLKTGLKEIISKYQPALRVTAQQNLLICDIPPSQKLEIDQLLAKHKIKPVETLPVFVRNALACVATPTCGLAVAESERVLPAVSAAIHAELARHALDKDDIILHMTGCPNGCARPFSSDIGIVGRSPGKYTLYLGGNILGSALNFEYQDLVPTDKIPEVLRGPLVLYKAQRTAGEGFGDFCRRVGKDALTAAAASAN